MRWWIRRREQLLFAATTIVMLAGLGLAAAGARANAGRFWPGRTAR
ncbi:hypothetical protein BJY16_006272 [Actinoplanes octamycinicus]|uniref:Uncharacterized protein n=1 Tax=Actinoplanes octamycinicus TaxID=135948 RepID=A0A7W7H2I9_9ACTN|nr:hypothetical protein [Actinoplanes octamycinicus]MBB4742813.1 hypothetical protein [Actinoplanes octamycinicus]